MQERDIAFLFSKPMALSRVPGKYRITGVLLISTLYPYSALRIHGWFKHEQDARQYLKNYPIKGAFFSGALAWSEISASL